MSRVRRACAFRYTAIILLFFVFAQVDVHAASQNRRSFCTDLVYFSVIFGGVFYSPTFLHQYLADSAGKKHIGYRIYFRLNDILAVLPKSDRAMLFQWGQNKDYFRIGNYFIARLKGTAPPPTMSPTIEDYFSGVLNGSISAEEYIKDPDRIGATCRHRAVILTAIFHEYGALAETKAGNIMLTNGDSRTFLLHSWTELKIDGKNFVFDPTWGLVVEAQEYYLRFNVEHKTSLLVKVTPTAWTR